MKYTIIILMVFSFNLSAQDIGSSSDAPNFLQTQSKKVVESDLNLSSKRKHAVSLNLGFFDPWIGVAYERVFFARWGMDVSLGLLGGSIGTKFYFPKLRDGKVSCLVGFSEGILLLIGFKHYVPAGITYVARKGFRLSVDVGPQIYHDSNENVEVGFSIKLGKAF